jgi:hypothetical protein
VHLLLINSPVFSRILSRLLPNFIPSHADFHPVSPGPHPVSKTGRRVTGWRPATEQCNSFDLADLVIKSHHNWQLNTYEVEEGRGRGVEKEEGWHTTCRIGPYQRIKILAVPYAWEIHNRQLLTCTTLSNKYHWIYDNAPKKINTYRSGMLFQSSLNLLENLHRIKQTVL